MSSPVKDNGDGTITMSARWTTWVALVGFLLLGGGTGYLVSGSEDANAEAWSRQRQVNSALRSEQSSIKQILAEIRTDIRWIIQREKASK